MIRRPPRGPGSATIDHHLTALAAERQGVGQSGSRCKVDGRGRFAGVRGRGWSVSQWPGSLAALVPSCRRARTTDAGVVVGNGSVLANLCKSGRQLSNKPLQRMKAASSRSTFTEPGPRGSSNEAGPPRGPGSATIHQPWRPSPLNGKALDSQAVDARSTDAGGSPEFAVEVGR